MKEDADMDPAATRAMPTPSRVPIAGGLHKSEGTSGSGRLEVRCPSCHSPTEVAVDTSLTDLTCSSCGSHFSLVDQSKATQVAPSLSKLGRFELIERLGVGGFGSVWKARDNELDRTVAIKIPRAGGMTPEEQEKFFREARAAAQLRHPSIVSVHEVGRDGDSVYIVSDFVRGVTLGDWLTGQQLTNREATELCAQIADALHHAHQQGVVHRDLKPANIIMDYDSQPHLMDFGMARRETGEVTMTIDGQVLGTPAYMSPEQAVGEAHTADRRSDVYSLGVILFQLLTGELPFRGNARMLIKQVIHDEPPSPRKLNANIKKDLETITLKCLEKDPARRYQTAEQLAAEFRRFLAGQPILARPIGHIEGAWRWIKRQPAAAAFLAFVILVAGASMAAFLHERDLRREIAAQKSEAELERNNAEAVVSYLTDDVLAKASPQRMPDKAVRDTLVKMFIEPAAETASERFKDRPLIEAAVRDTLAQTLYSLGRPELALAQAKLALDKRNGWLGENHPDSLKSLYTYANILVGLAKKMEVEQQIDPKAEQLSPTRTTQDAYQDAESRFRQGLEKCRNLFGNDHPMTISFLDRYATCLWLEGKQEAEPVLRHALDQSRNMRGENDHRTISLLGKYAVELKELGRTQEAEPLLKQALVQSRKVLGEDDLWTIEWRNQYATMLYSQGRIKEAEQLFNTGAGELLNPSISALRAEIGKISTVQFRVLGFGGQQLRYLNSKTDFHSKDCFTVVVKTAQASDFDSMFPIPRLQLIGKVVRVTGKLEERDGRIEIQIGDLASQLKVIESTSQPNANKK